MSSRCSDSVRFGSVWFGCCGEWVRGWVEEGNVGGRYDGFDLGAWRSVGVGVGRNDGSVVVAGDMGSYRIGVVRDACVRPATAGIYLVLGMAWYGSYCTYCTRADCERWVMQTCAVRLGIRERDDDIDEPYLQVSRKAGYHVRRFITNVCSLGR